jgi:hypothetical protein
MTDDGEYRATSDKLYDILGELRRIENEKRAHAIGSPRFVELAHEAERLSRLVFRWTEVQRTIADDSPQRLRDGEVTGRPIDAIEARPLDTILADWREADVRLAQTRPGTAEARELVDRIERLRDEFRAVQDAKRSEAG